jgi:hypothetical protein
MADTAIAITAGAGTNVDTRTEATNGNHRQVVVIGDPALNAGVAPVDATNGLSVNVTNASLTVASHPVTNAGTFAVQNTAATPAGTNNIGDVDILTISGVTPAFGDGAKGATVLRTTLATDSAGIITTGTAGTPSSQVLTVQGVASMTPILATTTNVPLTNFGAGEYETVAASQTAQVLGATGGAGDYISGLLVIPATTSPGNVLLLDNATSITVFTGGATSVSNLVPFFIPLGMISVSGAWKVTTGANVSVIGIGNFT